MSVQRLDTRGHRRPPSLTAERLRCVQLDQPTAVARLLSTIPQD